MRQTNNPGRRPRGRPNRKPQGNNRNQNFDSSGPDGRIRGGANQIYEKYLTLARDAGSAGDRIAAEAFYQHAEHYFRIMNESTDPESPNGLGQRSQQGDRDVNGRGPGDDRHHRSRDGDGSGGGGQRQPVQPQAGAAPVTPGPAAPRPAAGTGHSAPAPAAAQPAAEIPGMEPQPAMLVEPPQPAAQDIPAVPEADKPRRGRPRKRQAPTRGPVSESREKARAGAEPGPAKGDGSPVERPAQKADDSSSNKVEAQSEAPAERTPAPPEGDGLPN